MSVDEWCKLNSITKANYYYRMRQVRIACLDALLRGYVDFDMFEKMPRLFLVFKNIINGIVTKMKRNTSMKRLFIIGNGFDRAHNLPTSYWDFRKYIMTRYPDAESHYFIPECTLMPKGNEEYYL